MTRKTIARLLASWSGLAAVSAAAVTLAGPGREAAPPSSPPPSAAEARQRARLLHGAIHDTLQVVHARYFREGERLAIPAAALGDVFREMQERDGVTLRWLAVEGRAMNVDHEPRDEFERAAAGVLAAGGREHESAAGGAYRFAGPITLGAECLKCHFPGRSGNKSRTAGLLISIPIAEE